MRTFKEYIIENIDDIYEDYLVEGKVKRFVVPMLKGGAVNLAVATPLAAVGEPISASMLGISAGAWKFMNARNAELNPKVHKKMKAAKKSKDKKAYYGARKEFMSTPYMKKKLGKRFHRRLMKKYNKKLLNLKEGYINEKRSKAPYLITGGAVAAAGAAVALGRRKKVKRIKEKLRHIEYQMKKAKEHGMMDHYERYKRLHDQYRKYGMMSKKKYGVK